MPGPQYIFVAHFYSNQTVPMPSVKVEIAEANGYMMLDTGTTPTRVFSSSFNHKYKENSYTGNFYFDQGGAKASFKIMKTSGSTEVIKTTTKSIGILSPQSLGGKDSFILLDYINGKMIGVKGDYKAVKKMIFSDFNKTAKQEQYSMSYSEIQPLKLKNKLPGEIFVVEASFDNKPAVPLLIDTGAYITQIFEKNIGKHKIISPVEIRTTRGVFINQLIENIPFKMGNISMNLKNMHITNPKLEKLLNKNYKLDDGRSIQGFIGMNAFMQKNNRAFLLLPCIGNTNPILFGKTNK